MFKSIPTDHTMEILNRNTLLTYANYFLNIGGSSRNYSEMRTADLIKAAQHTKLKLNQYITKYLVVSRKIRHKVDLEIGEYIFQ